MDERGTEMSSNPSFQRQSPRVILRRPLDGRFDDANVLVVELGLGGAKFEYPQRIDIGRKGRFTCGEFSVESKVRHSIVLPARSGVVYHIGLSFDLMSAHEKEQLMRILLEEAQEQVAEWEANLSGTVAWQPKPARQSAVALRFLSLHLTNQGWRRSPTSDPNHPLDGITVPGDTPEEEILILCETFEAGDLPTRELLRRMATVTILERLREA
jgi:hypothetical protein